MGSGDVESVVHDVAAGTFDDAGGDGPAAGQGGWVVQVGRLVLHVSWGDDVRVVPGDVGVWPDRIWFPVVGGVRLTMSG